MTETCPNSNSTPAESTLRESLTSPEQTSQRGGPNKGPYGKTPRVDAIPMNGTGDSAGAPACDCEICQLHPNRKGCCSWCIYWG